MSRVRRGFKARRRKNKIFKLAKGFHFDRRTKWRHAINTVKRALHNMYKGRRIFRRDIRSLWIVRINAACKELGSSYSRLINGLNKKDIAINRKMLAHLAVTDPQGFQAIFNAAIN